MSKATIRWISGPLLRAVAKQPFGLHEAVQVGAEGVLGEVIRMHGDEITAQVYEDTTGLSFCDSVTGDGYPLSVRLSPGLLGGIFDGLLRPLSGLDTPFIPRGARRLSQAIFGFEPSVAVGQRLAGGQPIGAVTGQRAREQLCLVPPQIEGEVTWVAEPGEYREDDVICRLGQAPAEQATTMSHYWPVRVARPVRARLPVGEPVVTHTKRYVRSFWALDNKRAQARIYPAINPLLSYAEETEILADWWRVQGNTRWPELRRKMLSLLQEQVKLDRMARIIGRGSLASAQQVTLLCAELLTDAFLRQSAFSDIDRYSSPQRQTWMMRLLSRFEELAQAAIGQGVTPTEIGALPVFRRLQRMGEEIAEGEWQRFDALANDIEHAFHELTAGRRPTSDDHFDQ